jgi:hypothetical protein
LNATVVYDHVAPFARRAIPKRRNHRTPITANLDDRIAVVKDLRIHVAAISACRLENAMDRTNADLVFGRELLHRLALAGDFPDQPAARRRHLLAWAYVPDDRDNGGEPPRSISQPPGLGRFAPRDRGSDADRAQTGLARSTAQRTRPAGERGEGERDRASTCG